MSEMSQVGHKTLINQSIALLIGAIHQQFFIETDDIDCFR